MKRIEVSAAVVVMIGLPSVGKTTISRKLIENAPDEIKVIHIEFDSIFKQELLKAMTTTSTAAATATTTFDREIWKESRKKFQDTIEKELKGEEGGNKGKVVLVDDNSHLRSMRKSISRIASKSKASFIEIFIEPNARESLESNSRRHQSQMVPEQVILAMFEAIEAPEPTRFHWETNSITVKPIWNRKSPDDDRFLWKFIQESIQRGPLKFGKQDDGDEEERKEESRKSTIESTVHQFDLWSRRIVSSVIQSIESISMKSEVARKSSMIRSEFISRLRSSSGQPSRDFDQGDFVEKLKVEFIMSFK